MLRIIIGNAFFGLLDLSVGGFIAYIAGITTGVTFNTFQYIAGSFLASSPDIDVAYMYLRKGRVYTNHHEFVTHRPIIGIPICFLVCWAIGGTTWGIIGGICVLWHYLHDTKDLFGGGIALFWPFSRNYHSILHKTVTPEESAMNTEHNATLDTIILRPGKKVVVETTASTILLATVVGNTTNFAAAVAIAGFVWLNLICVWIIFKKRNELDNIP